MLEYLESWRIWSVTSWGNTCISVQIQAIRTANTILQMTHGKKTVCHLSALWNGYTTINSYIYGVHSSVNHNGLKSMNKGFVNSFLISAPKTPWHLLSH